MKNIDKDSGNPRAFDQELFHRFKIYFSLQAYRLSQDRNEYGKLSLYYLLFQLRTISSFSLFY